MQFLIIMIITVAITLSAQNSAAESSLSNNLISAPDSSTAKKSLSATEISPSFATIELSPMITSLTGFAMRSALWYHKSAYQIGIISTTGSLDTYHYTDLQFLAGYRYERKFMWISASCGWGSTKQWDSYGEEFYDVIPKVYHGPAFNASVGLRYLAIGLNLNLNYIMAIDHAMPPTPGLSISFTI